MESVAGCLIRTLIHAEPVEDAIGNVDDPNGEGQNQPHGGSELDVFRSSEQMQPKYGYQWGVQAEEVRPQPRRLLQGIRLIVVDIAGIPERDAR